MLTIQRKVRIEWGDCDPAGIVYFPRYFEYFDISTVGLFEALGYRKPALLEAFDIAGFPVVDVRSSFRIPSKFGDDVIIHSSVPEYSRSSFQVHHRLMRGKSWPSRASKSACGSAMTRHVPAASRQSRCRWSCSSGSKPETDLKR